MIRDGEQNLERREQEMSTTIAYVPARPVYRAWIVDWMHDGRWSSPRIWLAYQLRRIRAEVSTGEARRFRDYLLWLGCYPVRVRSI